MCSGYARNQGAVTSKKYNLIKESNILNNSVLPPKGSQFGWCGPAKN